MVLIQAGLPLFHEQLPKGIDHLQARNIEKDETFVITIIGICSTLYLMGQVSVVQLKRETQKLPKNGVFDYSNIEGILLGQNENLIKELDIAVGIKETVIT